MELRHLEQFVAVAEECHFTRAALRCEVVPSALSTSIRALEQELGAPLLHRTTRSVRLTEAGAAFLAEARRCLTAAAAARAVVGGVRDLLRGSLRIGGIPTFDLLDQPRLLQQMRREHPGLRIRYTRDTSSGLLDAVRAGRLDVAVLSLPDPAPTDVTVVKIASGPVLIACHRRHRLARQASVGFEELAQECFVAPPPGSRGRDYIDRICATAGVPAQVAYEVNDVAMMLDFVEAGLGVAPVIQPIAATRPTLHTFAVPEHSFTWTVGIVAAPADQTPPAARAFLQAVSATTPGPGRVAVAAATGGVGRR